jgi:hypothetical protein
MFQVFGHKHRQRILESKTNVRWGAGSVNPSHTDKQFEPGYNIIELKVAGEGLTRRIEVRSHLFQYQALPEGFRTIKNDDDEDVFCHSISFPTEMEEPVGTAVGRGIEVDVTATITMEAKAVAADTDAEASMGDMGTRHLVDRFWDLDASDRREIALELELISDEEINLPEPQRYGIALIRAAERNLLDPLEELVAGRE